MSRARLLNLTPHPIVVHLDKEGKNTLTLPSDGDLRLVSAVFFDKTPPPAQSYEIEAMGGTTTVSLPVVWAQEFVGLDEASPGFHWIRELTQADAIIVSMPVAHWLARTACPARIYSPAMGPQYAVRDATGAIKGTRALELHGKRV